ncbi:MAG: FAD-dependent oxidoreductase [Deltaproteobacteria bacterium]|nr:FAD-dependent oxidoreductase [Deltaproteobacteria bacterium]
MPDLPRPSEPATLTLPPRRAIVAAEADVLVVGAGPAGLGAALGASAAGARVLLAERYGFFGGNATAALVMPLMSFHTQIAAPEVFEGVSLYPMDHGPGEPVLAGVVLQLLERLVALGGAIPPSSWTGYVVPFDPEIFKFVAQQMLDAAGVQYLLHAFATDVVKGSAVEGAVFETKSGPVAVRSKVLVDCTGDGDLAARAGAPCEVGRDGDGLVQPVTLMFRMVGFDRERFAMYVLEHPDQWRGCHGLWNLIEEARRSGELQMPREDILFFATPRESEVSVNSTRVLRVLGTDVWDLTRAERESHHQAHQIGEFLRRRVPGFERAYVAQTGVQVGVRETRRVRGEYHLTADDVLQARKYDDVIARGTYPIDIHNPEGEGTVLKRVPPGEAYDIPLRCLVPVGVEGLLVAGRCISGTHEAHSSYRAMPIAMATGQAAGVCAALAALRGIPPRSVPVREVQTALVRQGADLRGIV